MSSRLPLDTHVLVRWLVDRKRLSREQTKELERAIERKERVTLSAITLLEIAMLACEGKLTFNDSLDDFLTDLRDDPIFQVLPLSHEVAAEVASLAVLTDPADRTIVATARVHGLRLVTSDRRIIDSNLVSVIE